MPTPQAPEVITFGCRLNSAESEAMAAYAADAGLGADAVIINTCAVTAEATRQARQAIRRARRERPAARIIVTGCAAQIDPAGFAAMAEVDHVIGNAEKARPETFRALAQGAETARVRVADIMDVRAHAPHLAAAPPGRTRAYVEIQNGCDHRCTFCIIPYGRGPARSAPAGEVVARIAALAAAGAPEVVLTGVDLTSWGADLPGRPSLGGLVRRILTLVPDLPRLRLSSLDVIEMDPALFDLVVREPRVAPHLHLSLQHGHDLILKRMRRRHSAAQALDLCARLKAARPEIALGADFIAGFPTETDEHFEALLAFARAAHLAYLHVFPFSPRAGTPAARMPQLDRGAVKARAARLRALGAELLGAHLDRWVGRSAEALIEAPGAARLDDFTPVRIEGGAAGARARFTFTGHDGTRLSGRMEGD